MFIGIFLTLYNLVLSTLQSMIALLLEHRNIKEELPMMDPKYYAIGLISDSDGSSKQLLFEFRRWMFDAMWHGILMTFIIMVTFVEPQETDLETKTLLVRNAGLKDQSTVIFNTIMHVIFIKLILELERVNMFVGFLMMLTIIINYIIVLVMSKESVSAMLDPYLFGLSSRSVIDL